MTYPTKCSIQGCDRRIALAHPLPSNMRFVCPPCEDAIFHSIMDRLVRAEYATKQAALDWRGILDHWRHTARQEARQIALIESAGRN
ncbi:MAG: hypothetical protein WAU89_23420 [Candidatus Acidiferrales bacterium]